MFATTGIVKGNTVYVQDSELEQYNGRRVIITVLDEENCCNTISDKQLFEISDSIITKNMKAYQELAK
ncbi:MULTISPECIES: hypothetical protein [unclassified Treponema]|uniref:hypothetical protein n=1 Tax=unclassified Treponema TaxID=2638727 RepID=UPI0020A43D41|nr:MULTISPECIES: hypothetical protein [unclassified Treponema]UTC67123.1 hypothetical protein E4O06_00165 [Treponema sp. OMZ 789]UTC69854.1 hypothetical protein E4O01_00165 [Treponema sp. OMZ 790]UTC72568.1 hypothetical protein E4O02_00165 [Treponema sp. OMZ 791]